MKTWKWAAAICLGALAQGAQAQGSRSEATVAATIAPIHSLAARVTLGVGEPALIVRPGASPHGYAMKPSEASALAEADIVFWTGPELELWLAPALGTLAADAQAVALADASGVRRLERREGGAWEAHGHEHDDGHDDEGHDSDGHDDDHDEAEHHDDDHDAEHALVDPHLWLDPENAKAFVAAMAEALAEADPTNAASYRANAEAARAELDALIAETDAALAPVRAAPYIVFHDAYQYFEARFATNAVGSIALSDADAPSPKRIAAIRDKLAETGAVCVFTEPQFPPKLVATVIEGSTARLGALDPIGADLTPGPDLYPALIRNMAASLVACLGG